MTPTAVVRAACYNEWHGSQSGRKRSGTRTLRILHICKFLDDGRLNLPPREGFPRLLRALWSVRSLDGRLTWRPQHRLWHEKDRTYLSHLPELNCTPASPSWLECWRKKRMIVDEEREVIQEAIAVSYPGRTQMGRVAGGLGLLWRLIVVCRKAKRMDKGYFKK